MFFLWSTVFASYAKYFVVKNAVANCSMQTRKTEKVKKKKKINRKWRTTARDAIVAQHVTRDVTGTAVRASSVVTALSAGVSTAQWTLVYIWESVNQWGNWWYNKRRLKSTEANPALPELCGLHQEYYSTVPAGSPSRGGDATSFYSVPMSVSVSMALKLYIIP